MIRITRGAEPAQLAAERGQRLLAARQTAASGAKLKRSDLVGYQSARATLYVRQHRKCGYCEDSMKMLYEPVEHFRPALRAQRGAGFPDHGYWWLAWTWENLLFACAICNSSHKRDLFPLADGSRVMIAEDQLPSQETAVFVDPADPHDCDPMDLIVFLPVGDRWVPTGRHGDPRGAAIVRLLGLDGPAHLPRYTQHVDEYLRPHIERLHGFARADDVPGFRAEWADATRHIRPVRPWAGLAHDVFDYHFPALERSRMGVTLPRP